MLKAKRVCGPAALIGICLTVIILSRLTQSYFIEYWFQEVRFDNVTERKFPMGTGGGFLFDFVYHLPLNIFYLIGGYCLALFAGKVLRGLVYAACLGVVGEALLYFSLSLRELSALFVKPQPGAFALGVVVLDEHPDRRGNAREAVAGRGQGHPLSNAFWAIDLPLYTAAAAQSAESK